MSSLKRTILKNNSSEKRKTEKGNSEQEDTFGKYNSEIGYFRKRNDGKGQF